MSIRRFKRMLNTTKRSGRTTAIKIDNQAYGRLLAEFFRVSPELFI